MVNNNEHEWDDNEYNFPWDSERYIENNGICNCKWKCFSPVNSNLNVLIVNSWENCSTAFKPQLALCFFSGSANPSRIIQISSFVKAKIPVEQSEIVIG